MNQQLSNIELLIQQSALSEEEKHKLLSEISTVGKQWNILEFKFDRAEKIKNTTAVLLEETIEELEQKRKAVEAHNRELEIESSLEKVRSRSLAMHHSNELEEVVRSLFEELVQLGLAFDGALIFLFQKAIRNIQLWIATTHLSAPVKIDLPYDDGVENNAVIKDLWHAIEHGEHIFNRSYSGKAKDDYFSYVAKHNEPKIPAHVRQFQAQKERWTLHIAAEKNSMTGFDSWSDKTINDEEFRILIRFARVFEQAYTRFLDLQKAEAQAREANIEASLERVRSRSMAMHKSDELKEAGELLWNELGKLGISSLSSGYALMDKDERIGWIYAPNPATGQISDQIGVLHTATKEMRAVLSSWKKKEPVCIVEMNEQETIAHQTFIAEKSLGPDGTILRWITAEQLIALSPKRLFLHNFNFNQGYLLIVGGNRLSEEQIELMRRFTKVFQQTYTRFLDLQKAEQQARESQIQLALERVRARTMAMQRSDELSETALVLFQQFAALGEHLIQITIGIMNEETASMEFRVTDWGGAGSMVSDGFKVSLDEPTLINKMYAGWKNGDKSVIIDLSGKDLEGWLQYRNKVSGVQVKSSDTSGRRVISVAFFSKGLICFSTRLPPPQESILILERFAGVFDLTYTRFLDLQKAEAQAREAKIEAALERVRAKAMAMHKSDDLSPAVAIVFEELDKLDLGMARCGIGILDKESRSAEVWTTSASDNGNAVQVSGDESIDIHPLLQGAFGAWLKGEDFSYTLEGEDLVQYYKAVGATNIKLPQSQAGVTKQFYYFAPLESGGLFAFRESEFPDEGRKVMRRFANVFNLTYKRFLDIQKAEAQAREAMIEAALERVRGKAMAMHNSNDLSDTASIVFTELRKLGVNPIRCGVGLLSKESRKAQLYSATSSTSSNSLSLVGWVHLEKHPVLQKIYDSWVDQEDYFPELKGDELSSYYQLLLAGLSVPVPDFTNDQKQYGYFVPFSIGCLYAWSETPYDDTEIKIFHRFAGIIDLTFRRYLELQQSETNARHAVKQAALDRIRADIASMRSIDDLDRITPLIWNELTILGVPFIRCGVFIMDDSHQLIHTFLSTPDGKAIAAFHLPYDTPGNIGRVVAHWKKSEIYTDHWDEVAFADFADTLVRQGALASAEQYLKTIPEGGFYLHFLPFLQGMLYVGNTIQLADEEMQLTQSVANAFSTAYARYEDFNKLEAAKKQVDSTLNELRVTQKQLIQSEKMASLGELTAGIAHEIQNPLNFVNNFSEVSNELIEELRIKNEGLKINDDEINQLLYDIAQNLEKINFHGKRADAIVKGMLQHSRSSTGQKELTDINALCDEYLRLAYHGLRAKDKTFNARFETDFDNNVGKINVIPQDIGRVILNLINNAFHTVSEKKRQLADGYEPTIVVSTRNLPGRIEIKVKDNGNGIPDKALDKIFQPFFTTKATGHGTGLGLSLSYDIIKAHGGEIKAQTKECEGSEFIIDLPFTS